MWSFVMRMRFVYSRRWVMISSSWIVRYFSKGGSEFLKISHYSFCISLLRCGWIQRPNNLKTSEVAYLFFLCLFSDRHFLFFPLNFFGFHWVQLRVFDYTYTFSWYILLSWCRFVGFLRIWSSSRVGLVEWFFCSFCVSLPVAWLSIFFGAWNCCSLELVSHVFIFDSIMIKTET